jgi:DNA-binding GntR family transcriptional regulator
MSRYDWSKRGSARPRRASLPLPADRRAGWCACSREELHLLHTHAIRCERYVDAISWDDAFHSYISEISDLPRLWKAIEISKAQLDRCRHLTVPKPGLGEATLVQHRNILNALVQKDWALSRRMMTEHLDKVYDGIVRFLASTHIG